MKLWNNLLHLSCS